MYITLHSNTLICPFFTFSFFETVYLTCLCLYLLASFSNKSAHFFILHNAQSQHNGTDNSPP